MRILITNDDSHRSPLLEIAVEYFSRLGEVSLVVPLHEQSWTGKSMTRFNPVHAQRAELFGRPAIFVSGTPADCVNLAIHNLADTKPDLVVSGINAGFNMGIGFLLSSGTVGACLEANLAGIPAIAISQAFDSATRNRYTPDFAIEPQQLVEFKGHTVRALDLLWQWLFRTETCAATLSCPITWNINLPCILTDPQVLRLAPLGTTRYGQVFREEEIPGSDGVRSFLHAEIERVVDTNPHCDSSLLMSGSATVSPVDLWALAGGKGQAGLAAILKEFTG